MRFWQALAVSVGIHAVFAALGAWWLARAQGPDTLAQLDLSALELSFAEQERTEAPAVPPPPDMPPPEESPETPASDLPRPPEMEPVSPPEAEEIVPLEPPPPAAAKRPPAPQPPAPPAAAPRQAAVDAPPRPRRSIRPDYPRGARLRGEQGEVELELEVGADGRVAAARIVRSCGYAVLDDAALAAVRAARFIPAKSGNTSVPSVARLKLRFQLK